jgi:hypothetical protein
MADLNQAASGVLKTAIQSDALSPVLGHDGPDAGQAVASVGKAPLGNAEAPLGDVAQAAQNGDRVKIAAAEKEGQAALRQGHRASLGGVDGSSPGANSPARLTVSDTENGLQKQIIAHDFTNQVLAYLVTGAFFALIVLLMFSTKFLSKDDTGVKDLLFTLLGVVATGWANIIGFYFGSSVGSAQKSQTISSVLLHGNPDKSPASQKSQAISSALLHGNPAESPAAS